MAKPKTSREQAWFNMCLDRAHRATDLAIEELMRTRGGQISGSEDDFQFILNLSKTPEHCLKTKINEYLRRNVWNVAYSFKETNRRQRDGDMRPIDLVISRHCSSETHEMFVVTDLKGEIFDKSRKEDGCGQYQGSYARFEAWCRLYYLPTKQRWYVHYVDLIIRHKSPAQRALFMIEHSGSTEEPSRAEEKSADKLCLFFETPQGGVWG
jgi:hypothetical protein